MIKIEARDPVYKDAIVTIPNAICIVRFIGAFCLLGIAVAGWRLWFLGLFVVLSLSDWVDGKLARWLHQRSDFGARLDSVADTSLYAGLVGGTLILHPEVLQYEWVWLMFAVSSYALTVGMGLGKFGRLPSYHTYGAKISAGLVFVAAICLVISEVMWPIRVAIAGVILTNLETTAMTLVLSEWRADVLTLFHIWSAGRVDNSTHEDSGIESV